MKFKFTCELCQKEVKRGNQYAIDVFEKEDPISSSGVICLTEVCESCSDKIITEIESLRKRYQVTLFLIKYTRVLNAQKERHMMRQQLA